MAWDFSTEPEFQKKLDWVKEFCEEKVEPLNYVVPYAIRNPDPAVRAYVRELQQEVKDHLDGIEGVEVATESVEMLLSRGAPDEQFASLRADVHRDILAGVSPAAAARKRAMIQPSPPPN